MEGSRDVGMKWLLTLLNEAVPLAEVESRFLSDLSSKSDQFKWNLKCIELISDKVLVSTQVIASEWLMYHFNKADEKGSGSSGSSGSSGNKQQQPQSCFISFLFSRLDSDTDPVERAFLYNLLSSSSSRKDYATKPSKAIHKSIELSIYDKSGQLKPLTSNKQALRRQLQIEDQAPLLDCQGVRSWFRLREESNMQVDNNNSSSSNSSNSNNSSSSNGNNTTFFGAGNSNSSAKKAGGDGSGSEAMSSAEIDLENSLYTAISDSNRSLLDLKPVMVCLPPPLISTAFDDQFYDFDYMGAPELPLFLDARGLFWIPPSRLELNNNNSSSRNNNSDSSHRAQVFDEEYRQIFASSFATPLTPQQTQKLLHNVRFDLASVTDLGLTPQKLTSLVETNEKVAMECLFQVADEPGSEDLLTSLIYSNLTVRSMEVVNRLIHSNKLPEEFINKYISHSIAYCNGMRNNRSLQNRFVRVLSAVMLSLVRNKIVSSQESNAEMSQFCIQFTQIKEASNLYKLLRKESTGSTA